MKNSDDTIGNRTRDLPTAPPLASSLIGTDVSEEPAALSYFHESSGFIRDEKISAS